MKFKNNQGLNVFSIYLIGLGVVAAFLIGLVVGQQDQMELNGVAHGGDVSGEGQIEEHLLEDVDFQLFWDAWQIVKANYVDQPVNETQLLYGAISGMVRSLEDPHSVFFTPDLNNEFLQELNGSFFGIGAEITIKNEQLQIVSPLPDTPAEQAGLRPGDYIIEINGMDTAGISLDYAVSEIRGERGTEVVLTIFRPGETETREISIIRDEIDIQSVVWEMLEGDIAYIELRYFNRDTTAEFSRIANEVQAAQPEYIILDMRNNPGGFLDVSIDIASKFIEEGVIVTERAYDGSENVHTAQGRAVLDGIPVIVLINQGSASASEIVAGALQDYEIATVIGMQSFGKGSVQTLFPLDNGSAIKLTIAKWLTPEGNTIEGEGITPDIIVDLTEEDFNNDRDPQLDRAIQEIQDPSTPEELEAERESEEAETIEE